MADLGSSVVYLASDLSRKRRAFIDDARQGLARLWDTDGTSLVMVPEERLAKLTDLVAWANRHLVLEAAVRKSPSERSVTDFGDLPWLRFLPDDDLAAFLARRWQALRLSGG